MGGATSEPNEPPTYPGASGRASPRSARLSTTRYGGARPPSAATRSRRGSAQLSARVCRGCNVLRRDEHAWCRRRSRPRFRSRGAPPGSTLHHHHLPPPPPPPPPLPHHTPHRPQIARQHRRCRLKATLLAQPTAHIPSGQRGRGCPGQTPCRSRGGRLPRFPRFPRFPTSLTPTLRASRAPELPRCADRRAAPPSPPCLAAGLPPSSEPSSYSKRGRGYPSRMTYP